MSDIPDGSGQIPRRAPRASDGGAPVSGALAIVLAVVAVVAGFLILRSISDGGETAIGDGGSTPGAQEGDADESEDVGDSTVPTLAPTTTTPELVVDGASVIVANANGVGGSASAMTRALETVIGFEVVDPVDSSSATGNLEESRIFQDPTVPGAQAVADSLRRVLGGDITVAPLPEVPPTSNGEMNGAGVLLMLGDDKAGKTIAEMYNEDTGAATVVTSPPIAGDTTTESTTG